MSLSAIKSCRISRVRIHQVVNAEGGHTVMYFMGVFDDNSYINIKVLFTFPALSMFKRWDHQLIIDRLHLINKKV